jgi:hypothetical protein
MALLHVNECRIGCYYFLGESEWMSESAVEILFANSQTLSLKEIIQKIRVEQIIFLT